MITEKQKTELQNLANDGYVAANGLLYYNNQILAAADADLVAHLTGFQFAEQVVAELVANQMSEDGDRPSVNEDPIYDVRVAVSATLRNRDQMNQIDHKAFTDEVVDRLPDFFRQSLVGAPTRPDDHQDAIG